MKKLKYEIFITQNNKQQSFIVGEEVISIGNLAECDVIVGDDGPGIKCTLQVNDKALVVRSFDLNYPIKINGKKYKQAKLNDSIFFKVGSLDIVLSVEEIDIEQEQLISEDIEEEFDQTLILTPKEIPVVPENLSDSPAPPEEIDVVAVAEKDIFKFEIKFDESNFKPLSSETYSQPNQSFKSYIDTGDETEEDIPSSSIIIEKDGVSLHIIHMNNGTVLEESFFSTKFKRIYLSNSYGKKNYFQVHDCDSHKSELAYIKGDSVSVVNQEGYTLRKRSHGKVFDSDEKTMQLVAEEKIILTKGTSQIILQLAKAIPKIKPANYFDIDEDALKCVAYAWVFAAFVLLNVLIVDEAKVKDEPVVIYKKIEIQPPETKVVKESVSEKVESSVEPAEEKPVEAPVVKAPAPKVEVKEVAKEPIKKVVKQKVVAKAKKVKKVSEPVVKEAVKPIAKPKKTYKFNFASNMASNLDKTKLTKLNSASKNSQVSAASAMDSSASGVTSLESKGVGLSKTKVSRFAAGDSRKTGKALGTVGLSGKTDSNTAYIQAKTKVLGALDPNLIRKIMREYIPQFRHCYQKELLRNPSVAGVFDLNFKINKDGKGVRTGVKSNGKGFGAKGVGCIKRVVGLIKFPRPKGGGYVSVIQPMNFYTNQ